MNEADRVLLDAWSTVAFGYGLEPEAAARIERYLGLLDVWNARLRLTGARDRATLVRKHVADALACRVHLPDRGSVLDLGTGAGLPGAVVACLRPDLTVVLLDSRQRPISFLAEVVRLVPLPNVRAIAMRAEDAARDATIAQRQRLVLSRAVRMNDLFRLAKPLLSADGGALSMQTPKTAHADAEAAARRYGYRTVEVRDYALPDDQPRRLILAR